MDQLTQSAGVQRLSLNTLKPQILNAMVIGVIIRSQNVKTFADKKGGSERAVWNFTMRDTIIDYINVTCWGNSGYISCLQKKFLVGDVVNIFSPKINIRQIDDTGEQYRPSVTSPFNLTLNEESSRIIIHEGENYHEYLPLLHYPTKPAQSHLTLAEVYNNGGTFRGDYINLLVAVQYVSPIKVLKAKADGRPLNKRDLVVFDCTHIGARITLWDDEFVKRADQWRPRDTILYIADMRCDWSNFERSMVPTPNSKTIITEDPMIPKAEFLRKYARTAPIHLNNMLDHMAESIKFPQSINTAMSVERIINIATGDLLASKVPSTLIIDNKQFTALFYGYVTNLDLDGYTSLVVTRCNRCNEMINKQTQNCVNLQCPVGSGSEKGSPKPHFDLRVGLSDHTGCLDKCRLTGERAEKMLGVTVERFLEMSDNEKCLLKWKFLFERCTVRLVVYKRYNQYPIVTILSYEYTNLKQFMAKLPIY